LTSYEKRASRDKEIKLVKAHEKEMKDEKEAERKVRSSNLLETMRLDDEHILIIHRNTFRRSRIGGKPRRRRNDMRRWQRRCTRRESRD